MKNWILAAKLLVSAGLIAWMLYLVDAEVVLERLRGVKLSFLLAALGILLIQVGLSALKWRLILRAEGHSEPYGALLRIYLTGSFFSLFLPTSFGGDVYRVAALRKTVQVAKGTASVLFDRITGLSALLAIAMVGIVAVAESPAIAALAATALMLGIGTFFALNTELAARSLTALEKYAALSFLVKLVRSFQAYRRNWRMVIAASMIALLFQFNIVIVNYCYVLALGLDIPFEVLVMVIPLAYLTEVLPISINGIGVRESALVGLLVSLGFPADYGLAIGFLIIAGRYLIGLLGGALYLAAVAAQGRSASAVGES